MVANPPTSIPPRFYVFDTAANVFIRHDHIVPSQGAPFDASMRIYPDGSDVRADYVDTTPEKHVIHYRLARYDMRGPLWATFESRGDGHAPGYRLTYTAMGTDRLHVRFEIAPPGGDYKTLTEGDLVSEGELVNILHPPPENHHVRPHR